MAVLSTKRLQICGLKKDRKAVLETLQRFGEVEIIPAKKGGKIFKKSDVSKECQTFEKSSALAQQAIDILDKLKPEKKGIFEKLDGPQPVTVEDFSKVTDEHRDVLDMAEEIVNFQKEINEAKAAIPKLESNIEILRPWSSFDLPLDFEGTVRTKAFIGSFEGQVSEETVYKVIFDSAGADIKVNVDIINQLDEITCVMVVCLREDERKVSEALQRLEFARAPITDINPAEEIKSLQAQIDECRKKISHSRKHILEKADFRDDIKVVSDYYRMRAERYRTLQDMVQSQHVFVIRGYVSEDKVEELQSLLSKFDIVLDISDPGSKEDAPVRLKNNRFATPVEEVVKSYSLPGKDDLDPSFLTAAFYYILFGMMFSDAGYGLLLVILTSLALKKCKHLEPSKERLIRMFRLCGVATAFWGFMFGSFFGDAVNIIATTFFNRPDIALNPIWFNPVDEPMKMLVFAFTIGIIHLFLGLFAQMYNYIREGKVLDAIYDDIFWMMFVGGCIALLLTMEMVTDMMGLSFTLSPQAGQVAKYITLIGLVGIILTGGRESKSWVKRIMKGAYGAYGVTGYLSDILSYSRLLALGLATGVIASVFNKIGSMFGSGIVGAILFIIVFLIGHTLNFLINVLGAYVHANRLQYVEFYSKFYEGGGRDFAPFTEKTKYYKVEED